MEFIEEKAVELWSYLAVVTHHPQSVLCCIMTGFLNSLEAETVKIHALALSCFSSTEAFPCRLWEAHMAGSCLHCTSITTPSLPLQTNRAPQHGQKSSHTFTAALLPQSQNILSCKGPKRIKSCSYRDKSTTMALFTSCSNQLLI